MAETLLDLYKAAEEKSRLSNLSRMEQAKQIYSDIIERYQPGGAFGAGYESVLRGQKTRDVGSVAQRDISRGLYGIRPYEAEWESTVGAPARLKLEDIRMERLSQSQQGLASFITDIDEPYPDFGTLMQAYASQASAPSGGGSSYGGYKQIGGWDWLQSGGLGGGYRSGPQTPTTPVKGTAGVYGGGSAVKPDRSTLLQTPGQVQILGDEETPDDALAQQGITGAAGAGQDPRTGLQEFTQKSLGIPAEGGLAGAASAFDPATQFYGAYGKIYDKIQYDPNNPSHRVMAKRRPDMYIGV